MCTVRYIHAYTIMYVLYFLYMYLMLHAYFKLNLLKPASLNVTGFSSLSLKIKNTNKNNIYGICIMVMIYCQYSIVRCKKRIINKK